MNGIVDAHVHVASPDHRRYPRGDAFPNAPQFAGPIEEFEAASQSRGVVQAVLVQPSQYGFANTYLIEAARSRPECYAGMALVDPADPRADEVLAELVSSGVGAIRLGPNFNDGRDWLGETAEPLFRRAQELAVVGNLFIRPAHLPAVETWLEAHRGLTVVIDHLARPDLAEDDPLEAVRRLSRLARFERLYVKVSALPAISKQPYPHRDTWAWIRVVENAFGAARLMWGADFPMTADGTNYGRSLELIQLATEHMNEHERLSLLAETARAVYHLPEERRLT